MNDRMADQMSDEIERGEAMQDQIATLTADNARLRHRINLWHEAARKRRDPRRNAFRWWKLTEERNDLAADNARLRGELRILIDGLLVAKKCVVDGPTTDNEWTTYIKAVNMATKLDKAAAILRREKSDG